MPTGSPRYHQRIQAIADQRPPPCEPCAFWNKCKSQRLACSSFAAYVGEWQATRGDRKPTRQIYKHIFRHEDHYDRDLFNRVYHGG